MRVHAETLDLAQALAEQRGGGRAELLRAALDIVMLIIAASGPPAEQRATEVYGTLTGVRLAQRLRPSIATVLDFLSRYSAAPVTIVAASPAAPTLPQHTQDPTQTHSALSLLVDNAVNAALDAFGVGTLGDTE